MLPLRRAILMLPVLAFAMPTFAHAQDAAIRAAVADPARPAAQVARDRYRHPVETLGFFGVRADQTVVEFSPGGGWYTQILAPLAAARGHYIGLVEKDPKGEASFAKRLAENAARFGPAKMAVIDIATGANDVPDGSADVVLTFRNVHNLIMAGGDTPVNTFKAFFRMLKPGGTLGVVDHHLPESAAAGAEKETGYIKRSTVLALAKAAGFVLAGESPVNANPADTHDWPKGVWTLPPSLELGDKDREKYLAVGESDRMTLKFVKPR